MKIAIFGLNIPIGKYKYSPTCFQKIVKKFAPKKETPYTVEFIGEDFLKADIIVYDLKKKLDLIFLDLDTIEKRLIKTENYKESEFLKKIQQFLEKEIFIFEQNLSDEEKNFIKNLPLVTSKPSIGKEFLENIDKLIEEAFKKLGLILFFTVNEKEARAWAILKGSTILEAAAKIHSDLAKGFIKGEVINCKDLDNFFNLNEARQKGLIRVVNKDYIMEDGNIIEIKFSV